MLKLQAKIKRDLGDKKITVSELLDIIKMVVEELGFGDVVILNLENIEKND